MHWTDLFNSVGSLFIVATASTKTMVPLRILAIVANCFLIAFYAVSHQWVPFALQAVALPLNAYRLYQMLVLIRNVRDAIRGNTSMDWLKPFMSGRRYRKGDVLFAKGETASEMFCPVTGRYLLVELGIEVMPGQLVGELAMLAPDNRRTATLECIEEARRCRSPTSRSSNFTIKIRRSVSTFCVWRRRGCLTMSAAWRPNSHASNPRKPRVLNFLSGYR